MLITKSPICCTISLLRCWNFKLTFMSYMLYRKWTRCTELIVKIQQDCKVKCMYILEVYYCTFCGIPEINLPLCTTEVGSWQEENVRWDREKAASAFDTSQKYLLISIADKTTSVSSNTKNTSNIKVYTSQSSSSPICSVPLLCIFLSFPDRNLL